MPGEHSKQPTERQTRDDTFSLMAEGKKVMNKIVPSGYMSLMRHGLLVRLKYVEVVSVFTA